MRKKKYIGISIFLIIVLTGIWILKNDSVEEPERQETEILENETENRENILTDSSVIDLGNHIVAYRTSSDIYGSSLKGEYLAIHDLTSNEILYLPNIYEKVYDMAIEEDKGIFISYSDMGNDSIREIHIPVQFPTQMDTVYEVYTQESLEMRILTGVQKNTKECVEELPKLIWEESTICKERTYEISFERTSPVYKSSRGVLGGSFADYCLTVKDEEDNIVSEKIMVDYAIAYEEVYWFTDFSGDGFPDIAFCTDYYSDKTSYAYLEFMIWNAEENTYEEKPLPVRSIAMPVWNETQSSVVLFYNGKEYVSLGMYSFCDGDWELVGELVPIYNETDVDEDGNMLIYGWKEIFYENGEAVEENSIIKEEKTYTPWFDEESIWCKRNKENSALYPGDPAREWETIEVMIGEDTIYKYVREQ